MKSAGALECESGCECTQCSQKDCSSRFRSNRSYAVLEGLLEGKGAFLYLSEFFVLFLAHTKLLLVAGARVDLQDRYGATALQDSIKGDKEECAELLLDAGSKVSSVSKDLVQRKWCEAMLTRRSDCKRSAIALYGLLRKRWLVGGVEKVPRDMINVLTQMVWDTRHDRRWGLLM